MVSSVSTTVTNWPGHSRPSRFSNVAFRWMVPVEASTVLSITESYPVARAAGIVLRRHAHCQLAVGAEAPDGRQVLLGHAEVHEDRRDLVDHHQRHVVHLDQVAGVHQQVPGASRNGRVDLAITQVELGPVHRGQVARERRARAFDAGLGGARGGARDVGVGARLVGLRARSQPALLQLRLQSRVAIRVLGLRRSRAPAWLRPGRSARGRARRRLPPGAAPPRTAADRWRTADRPWRRSALR